MEGAPGVQSADVWPSEALNLAALMPAPILVAPEVLQGVEAGRAGDSPTAAHACVGGLAAPPMTVEAAGMQVQELSP